MFKGTFNGNGHIISNLTINRPTADYQGLFGFTGTNSKILNVAIERYNIIGESTVAGLIGHTEYAKVENSYAKGDLFGYSSIGGLIGSSLGSSIATCYTESKIESRYLAVGGLIGYAYGTSMIDSCFAKADINGYILIGGLIGSCSARSILNSYSIGNLVGQRAVGGLIGYQYSTKATKVSDCISITEVKATKYVGSFIGQVTEMEVVTTSCFLKAENLNNIKTLSQNLPKIGATTYSDHTLFDYDISACEAKIEEVQIKSITTNLQVGTKSDENSQIGFNTNFEYALGRIKRNGIQCDEALSLINTFLDTLSEKQTQLGATQNRLDSALDEITTQYENLASARSTIRDADMAELSSQYIQQQILQEASATLMAVANQSPAIALQLI